MVVSINIDIEKNLWAIYVSINDAVFSMRLWTCHGCCCTPSDGSEISEDEEGQCVA